MNRKVIIILISLLLAFALGLFLGRTILTAKVIAPLSTSTYSWTKAFCNDKNECMDFLITCEDGKATSIKPVSPVLKYDENWTDPRGNESEKLC